MSLRETLKLSARVTLRSMDSRQCTDVLLYLMHTTASVRVPSYCIKKKTVATTTPGESAARRVFLGAAAILTRKCQKPKSRLTQVEAQGCCSPGLCIGFERRAEEV